MDISTPIMERFYSKFTINTKTSCWEWNIYKNPKHYPKFKLDGRGVCSHRLSYELHTGKIEPSMFICHKCHNRRCVNPNHLFMSSHHNDIEIPLSDRFYSRVSLPNENGCMEWIGSMADDGYGIMSVKKAIWYAAHRYSYEFFLEKIPEGMYVCHKCDNRKCVAPNHLFLGTNTDNMRDMSNKNRAYMKKGEAHPFSKLSNDETREIKKTLLEGETQVNIAKKYKVHQSTISYISSGKIRKETF